MQCTNERAGPCDLEWLVRVVLCYPVWALFWYSCCHCNDADEQQDGFEPLRNEEDRSYSRRRGDEGRTERTAARGAGTAGRVYGSINREVFVKNPYARAQGLRA